MSLLSNDPIYYLNKILTAIQTGGNADSPTKSYSGYEVMGNQQLTTTPTLVTGFTPTIAPVGVGYTAGTFTVTDTDGGIYEHVIERIYENEDINPASPVEITIDIHINDVSLYSRTFPIGAATAGDEPAYLPLTTDFIYEHSTGDTVKVYVSASEGGVTPASTSLYLMRVTSKKIFASA